MLQGVKSWQTTVCGILGAIIILAGSGVAVLDSDPATGVDITALFSALGILGIGYFARDNNKRSESVDASK